MLGVDSSILVDVLRNRDAAKLEKLSAEDLCTSEIVVYELLYGIYANKHFSEQKLRELWAVLDTFTYIFQIERKTSIMAAQIAGKLSKAGQTIGDADALIAGNLLANGCTRFITKNVKDFERIKELKLVKA